MGFFSSKKTTYDPFSAYTPEQRASIQALMGLASTGSGGGITLGQPYVGNLGYYQQTPGELDALSGLYGLINGGDLSGARDVYSSMANNTFNPDDPSSGYGAFSRALAKAGAESQDVINREAARTGGVFGSGRGRDTASLQSDLANQRGMFLAELFNQGQNRALQGAQGLQSLVGTQQNLFNQLASQAAVDRILKDQQAKDQLGEFYRTRAEELSRIDLMNQQWQTPMGAITTKSPSTFSKIASPLLGAVGTAIGGPIGGSIGGSLGGLFGGSSTGGFAGPLDGGRGFDLSSILNLFSGFGGNVPGTGLFGTRLGGSSQSDILGFNTAQFR